MQSLLKKHLPVIKKIALFAFILAIWTTGINYLHLNKNLSASIIDDSIKDTYICDPAEFSDYRSYQDEYDFVDKLYKDFWRCWKIGGFDYWVKNAIYCGDPDDEEYPNWGELLTCDDTTECHWDSYNPGTCENSLTEAFENSYKKDCEDNWGIDVSGPNDTNDIQQCNSYGVCDNNETGKYTYVYDRSENENYCLEYALEISSEISSGNTSDQVYPSEYITFSETNGETVIWTFDPDPNDCTTTNSVSSTSCYIPSDYNEGAEDPTRITVAASKDDENYDDVEVTATFFAYPATADPEQLVISCDPSSVTEWDIFTCEEINWIAANWSFEWTNTSLDCADSTSSLTQKSCKVNEDYEEGRIIVTAIQTWYIDANAEIIVTEEAECDADNLNLCDSSNCSTYWYWCIDANNSSNAECVDSESDCTNGCNATYYSNCDTETTCEYVGKYWCEWTDTCVSSESSCSTVCNPGNLDNCDSGNCESDGGGHWCIWDQECKSSQDECSSVNISCNSPNAWENLNCNAEVSVDWIVSGLNGSCNPSKSSSFECLTDNPDDIDASVSIVASVTGYSDDSVGLIIGDPGKGDITLSGCPSSVIDGETFQCSIGYEDDTIIDNSPDYTLTNAGSGSSCNFPSPYTTINCTVYKGTQTSFSLGISADYHNSVSQSINIQDKPSIAISCDTDVKAGESFVCEATCDGSTESVDWTSTSLSCSEQTSTSSFSCTLNQSWTVTVTASPLDDSECVENSTTVAIGEADDLIITFSPTISEYAVEGDTMQLTSSEPVIWDFLVEDDDPLNDCDTSEAVTTVYCTIPYDYLDDDTETAVISVSAQETAATNRTATTEVVIEERETSDLTITCDDDITAYQEFSCSAQCNGKSEDVDWNNTECVTWPASATTCQFDGTWPQTLYAEPSDSTSDCDLTYLSIAVAEPEELEITCAEADNGYATTGDTFQCTSNLPVAWTFDADELAGCNETTNVTTVNCQIPYEYFDTATSSIVNISASTNDQTQRNDTTQVVIEERETSDLKINCDDDLIEDQEFSCSAQCNGKSEDVDWNNSECVPGPASATICKFTESGTKTLSATPNNSESDCDLTYLSIAVEEPPNAEITCTWPFYIDESFTCTVECEDESVSADWSIGAESGNCSANGSSTQCTTDVSTIITASNAGICNAGSTSIELSYHDLTLECNMSTVYTGNNENNGSEFNCYATWGNQEYTWTFPNIVNRSSDYTSDSDTQTFSVQIDSVTDYPDDWSLTIQVKDWRNESQSVTIELIPPAIIVEEIYTIGNAGISIGATEEIYIQLNAIGETEDITTIQAQLLKWSCDNATDCSNKQIFNLTNENLTLTEESSASSGTLTLHNLLYELSFFIPDYEELTDGIYTYEVTVYDQYNQQTTVYLETFIGTLKDGDINGDQSIDVVDIVKTVMYYLNPSETPTDYELDAVDFNSNQQIDLVDVIKVIQEALQE